MLKWFSIILLFLTVSTNGIAQDLAKIPNVFTPNNDGINDIFQVRTTGAEALTVTIYNRYGGVVYRYFGLNGNWDGRTHAGDACVDGVYFVVAEVTLPDGSRTVLDQHVTLVR